MLDPLDGGVPMDDQRAVVAGVEEEGAANPEKISLLLLVERDAGADAGMDEDAALAPIQAWQPGEEASVVRGQSPGQRGAVLRVRAVRSDPVGEAGRSAAHAVAKPLHPWRGAVLVKELQHGGVVISFQYHDAWISRGKIGQQLHHAGAVRATVDQVADMDEGRRLGALARTVCLHAVMRRAELVEMAVDVADGINGHGPRKRGLETKRKAAQSIG